MFSFFASHFIICTVLFLLAGIVALGMYGWNAKTGKWTRPSGISSLLPMLLRWLALFLLFLVLLNPFFKFQSNVEIPPKIAVLLDISSSMKLAKGTDTSEILAISDKIYKKLRAKYQTEFIPFADKIYSADSLSFSGKSTNLFEPIREVYDANQENNLKAIVVVSDGNYNQGNNPAYLNFQRPTLVHSMLIGDSTPIMDFSIDYVDFPKLSYLDEVNQFNINISSQKAADKAATVNLFKINGQAKQILSTKQIVSKTNADNLSILFEHKINTPGIHRYRVEVSCAANEMNCANNSFDFYVEVVDGKKKILLFAEGPHPDLSAIKQSLLSLKNYEVTTAYSFSPPNNLEGYDLVWFFNLPSSNFPISKYTAALKTAGTSVLFTIGSQTNIAALNSSQTAFKASSLGNFNQDISPVVKPNPALFVLNPTTAEHLQQLPPLSAPYIDISPIAQMQRILDQKIGNVLLNKPMLQIGFDGNQMVGCWIGENIWRWRIMEYQRYKNWDGTEDLLAKVVNQLAIKRNKKRFRVNFAKSVYTENEPILSDAIVYNSSYQPVNSSKVTLSLRSDAGYTKELEMIPNGQSYQLDLGALPSGNYYYSASTTLDGTKMEEQGSFVVLPFVIENQYTPANYNDMHQLATANEGTLYTPQNLENLVQDLLGRNFPAEFITQYRTLAYDDIVWIMLAILLLLSLEWLLRKYYSLEK